MTEKEFFATVIGMVNSVNDYREISGLVDYLEENNSPFSRKVRVVYEICESIERLKRLKSELNFDEIKNNGELYGYSNDSFWKYRNSNGEVSSANLEDIPKESLFMMLLAKINLPTTIKIFNKKKFWNWMFKR